ncbi:MAG: glycosyltransferase family 4 protein [Alphaproteobacteria bacterium]
MKPPTAPTPSGDRQMARQLMAALGMAGHQVELASIFRSRDGAGDSGRQQRIHDLGGRISRRLQRRFAARAAEARPELWFTYHLYHKAPDWLGPSVSEAMGIPYVIAEASFAPKRADGPWSIGHEAAECSIRRADAIIGLNSGDAPCVLPLLDDPDRLFALRPFTDVAPYGTAADRRDDHRSEIVAEYGLDADTPIVLAVAMMRDGDKLSSYRLLGAALERIADQRWQLIVVGDGPARDQVAEALAPLGATRVHFAGRQKPTALPRFYAAADLLLWPAIREAYGMALVEAQAAGLAVVAGDSGGVGDIVDHGETGLVVPAGDIDSFAAAAGALLADAPGRAAMGARAREAMALQHSLPAAARKLDRAIRAAAGEGRRT